MYWPIGSPNVYALSRQPIPRTRETHDGLAPNPETVPDDAADTARDLVAQNDLPTSQSKGEPDAPSASTILSVKPSRGGTIFATITHSTLTVWESKPTVALASISRSPHSVKAYGANSDLLFRPDALVIVVQTTQNFLIIYSVAADPNARVYQTEFPASARTIPKANTDSYSTFAKSASNAALETGGSLAEGDGIREVNLRFRMVMRIDAGISAALALEDELIVATQKPAALQCIRWPRTESNPALKIGPQTSTELLSKITWVSEKCNIMAMVHDRPMNLTCWITDDGRTYAVQRRSPANVDMDNPASLFQGHCFHEPDADDPGTSAITAAVNARFSLIAVGCADGDINVYVVKDYVGNIPLSHIHRLPVTPAAAGVLQCVSYSPDGHCLFAGYENGWAMWSVYGKPGATSFSHERSPSDLDDTRWLQGVISVFWIGNGCELVMLGAADDQLWSLDIARSATTGCYAQANLMRGLLQCSSHLKLYKGHEAADPTTFPTDMSLWLTIQVPPSYLAHQWPIKYSVVSPDSKYIAAAGRRGLVHYSVPSGRWRTFDDPFAEREFCVRGGMCWFRHFLIACVESDRDGKRYQIRVYPRDKALDYAHVQHIEGLTAPAIFMATSGADSLLVYTHDNTLLHYVIVVNAAAVRLVQVGQIGFHGIIKAPPRVRAISWMLSEDQLQRGDPTQDVSKASVMFLVDGKLVLLQPSTNEQGELKYDMRVIAQDVEYFLLLRDSLDVVPSAPTVPGPSWSYFPTGLSSGESSLNSLRDSLWYFNGTSLSMWLDVQDVLSWQPSETGADLPPTVQIPVDFYPLFAITTLGVVYGLDTDLVRRKDIDFSFFRLTSRTQLFLPQILRHHLTAYNSPAALHVSEVFRHLPYFPHALEVLLHDILDSEVDTPPISAETAMLPTTISFLSSFPSYLDVIVNCTRKTELRSWRTLFTYLPPVLDLFEQSLVQGKLKTAAGYLLVFHTLQGEEETGEFEGYEYARLLRAATGAQDWELCSELARFLVGIDESGKTLQVALSIAGLRHDATTNGNRIPPQINGIEDENDISTAPRASMIEASSNGLSDSPADYFTFQRSSS